MGFMSMNAQQLTDKADQWSENGVLKLLGRYFMLISVPALIWLSTVMWDFSKEQALTKGQFMTSMEQLRSDLAVLKATVDLKMTDRYTATDAKRDQLLLDQRNAEQDRRLGDLVTSMKENRERIRVLETKPYGGPH
jgi:hypothetical protein